MSLNLLAKMIAAFCGTALAGLTAAGVSGHAAPWWVSIVVGALGTAFGVLAQSPVDHEAIAERKAASTGGGGPPAAALVLIVALGAALVPGCGTTSMGKGPTTVPVINGVVDCALPTLFKTTTFAALVSLADRAIAQQDPIGALETLAMQYGPAEVDCVIAYLHDLGETQKAAAPHNEVVAHRIDVSAQWLARQKAAGVEQVVNWGTVQ